MAYTGTRYPRPARRPAFKERLWVRGTNGRIANWNGADVDRPTTYYAPLVLNQYGTYQSPNGAFNSTVGDPAIRLRTEDMPGSVVLRLRFTGIAENRDPFIAHYEGIIINGHYSPMSDWTPLNNQIDYTGSDSNFKNAALRHMDRIWISFVNSIP